MTEANALALVVDDEHQIRRFLRAGASSSTALRVEEAETGQGALTGLCRHAATASITPDTMLAELRKAIDLLQAIGARDAADSRA
jgi:CheY-like chemotaxis protein